MKSHNTKQTFNKTSNKYYFLCVTCMLYEYCVTVHSLPIIAEGAKAY
jgi:hypothetical protein